MTKIMAGLNFGETEPRGLTDAAFNALQTREWTESLKNKNQTYESCPICYIDYEEGHEMKELSCNHAYHTGCLQSWVKKNATCPICKKEIR